MTGPRRGVLALLLVLSACDGVGRALVETAPEGVADNLPCEFYACKDQPATNVDPLPNADVDPQLQQCPAISLQHCDPVDETAPGFSRPAPGVCQRSLSLDEGAFDPEAFRQLSCAKLRLARSQSSEATVLRVEDVTWSQLDVEIESSGELALELVRAKLTRVQVRLRGPVTLRVIDSPEVAGMALATDSADATVDFRVSEAATVRVGSAEAEFAGTLAGEQSMLDHIHLFARDVRLEVVALDEALVQARRLEFVDVTSRTSRLRFDEALIAASRFTSVDVEECGKLSLYDSHLAGFRIPACTNGPTRVVGSSFRKGSLDGDILSDGTDFRSTAFGLHDPTDLQLWDNNLSNVNFCGNSDRVVLGGKTSAECAVCREVDGSSVPIDACADENAMPMLLKCCPALELFDACRPDADRMRPPFN